MRIDILTLFPDMCEAVVSESIIGRARKAGKVEINCVNIRDFSGNKHNKVDDTPYGGGMGMIMAAEPIYNAYMSLFNEGEEKPYLIYLSPKGQTFNQGTAVELSQKEH
ncbi:MAG: tRNA (guanosine(37)-N1)-methyltransferase TrmD, partial [Clostridia bacterium]|nr:tRNA (guanosine(37)-N1)-methyltransferase TrmD [Clostridia bacterium]